MLLALDAGNTNITMGVFDGEKLLFVSRMTSDSTRMQDQYAVEIKDILALYGVEVSDIDGAVISSVVPRLQQYMAKAVKRLFKIEPVIVSAKTVKDLDLGISDPESTGADLIVGVVAVKTLYSYPAIIIDMGTATTITVLDKKGTMIGGSIIPGIGISLDALVSGAALLSSVQLEAPPQVIGTSTVECVQSGSVYGSACMIDGLVDRMEEELGYECRVIATGGLAETVVKNCRREIELSDTLLLDGLKIIYEKNK